MTTTQRARSASKALTLAQPPETSAAKALPALALAPSPPPGLKARQLFAEAQKASLDHVAALQAAVASVRELLGDVVAGGEVYAPGLAEFAGRLGEDLLWKSKTLDLLAQRQRERAQGFAKAA
jgi:hypothetical protein